MNKIIMISFSCLLLTACSSYYSGNRFAESYEQRAYLIHHTDDSVGSSAFPTVREASGRKVFIFDPNVPAWAAYDASGKLIKTGRASGGKAYCPDIGRGCKTVTGRFSVHAKKGPECVSKKFPVGKGGAPMPNCMFFHKGYAIHGSYNVPNYNASHGCIRVLPSAASWLNNNFMDMGTTVIVKSY